MTQTAETKASKASTRSASKASSGFTVEERAAMKARARELKNAQRGADGEKDILAVIAKTPESERSLCERMHKINPKSDRLLD